MTRPPAIADSAQTLAVSLHWRWADGRAGLPFDPAVLTEAESIAARRFHREADGNLWRQGRFLMRRVLADRLGLPPHKLPLARGPQGKPWLAGRWRFNLSHAHGLAVLAVAEDEAAEIGIDIEGSARPVSPDLIRGATAPAERGALEALPPERRAPAFLQLWTRKESVLKAVGCGLSVSPAAILPGQGAHPETLPASFGAAADFTILDLAAPPGHLAALAVRDARRRRVMVTQAGFL